MASSRPLTQPPDAVDARVAARCAQQQGVISRAQARDLGLTRAMERSRLRSGRLFEIHAGVLSLTPTLPQEGRLGAALLWVDGTLSGLSVLAFHELMPWPELIHVTVANTTRAATRGVHLHRTRGFARGDVTRVRGLRMTTVGRALLDVASSMTAEELRPVVHEAQYRRLVDPLSLRRIIDRHPGHPGRAVLAALDPAPRRAESGLEARLYRALALVPGTPAERQLWITTSSGRRIRADAAYVDERVLVEADGRTAHARMLAFETDRVRDNDAAADGWLTLRYPAVQLRAPRRVADEVLSVLHTRGGRDRGRLATTPASTRTRTLGR